MANFVEYILLGMASAATIGPVTIETIRRGLRGGFAPAFFLNMGAVFVDAIYLLFIFFGLSSFIANPAFKLALGLFGAVLLVFLGAQNIREFSMKKTLPKAPPANESKNSFLAGILINLFNPMALIAWLAFYGIVSSNLIGAGRSTVLASLFFIVFGAALWSVILSFMAHMGKKVLNETLLRYISLASGVLLIGFGLYFGYNGLLGY